MSVTPTLTETVLGAFLHDIGKFLQRAHGSFREIDPAARAREQDILPVRNGRYSHKHALWSEHFFTRNLLRFPTGINANQVRHVAVFHHKPEAARPFIGAIGQLAAEADRLASGMDRKPQDEVAEQEAEGRAWDAFIRTPLRSPFSDVRIGLGEPPLCHVPLGELKPDADLFPTSAPNTSQYQNLYAKLWERCRAEFDALGELNNPDLFCESLLSISERFISTIPSSTKDQPDVSLHDHSRAAAAIAAALYRWHERHGTLDDEAAIRQRDTPKFRFLGGDLSGIQPALFRLANQQVRGVNKILRARSFFFAMATEAAALLCRHNTGLPVFSLLENAGGRFLMLVPDTPEMAETVKGLRTEIDGWMFRRYFGEIALNLSLSAAFNGNALMRANYGNLRASAVEAAEEAKLRAFEGTLQPVIRADYGRGVCMSCGVRPAAREHTTEQGSVSRCEACNDEVQLGRDLPRITHIGWRPHDVQTGPGLDFFGGVRLEWYQNEPRPLTEYLAMSRIYRGTETSSGCLSLRFLANYVPRLRAEELARYEDLLDEDEERSKPGDIKTFEMLARDAQQPTREGDLRGEPFLAVLKADADRLGAIFSRGLGKASIGLTAGLSRLTDFFFTGRLTELLRTCPEFQSTYTVYAGGDDLLLIGPWNRMAELAVRLRDEFALWTGNNPNVTISAGLELMKPAHPINRVARAAEARLEAGKNEGRNRICALDRVPLNWEEFRKQLEQSRQLAAYLQQGQLSQVFVYRLLYFAEERRKAEGLDSSGGMRTADLAAATWRARWGYQLARHLMDIKDSSLQREIQGFLNSLLGLDADLARRPGAFVSPRPAVTIAIYENRTGKERRSF
jgi:CRISPR-associated protein Csm1